MESESLLVAAAAAAAAAAVATASYMVIARSAAKKERKSPFVAKIETEDINSIKKLLQGEVPFAIEIAVHHIGKDIALYASVPAELSGKAKISLDKAYPGNWSESDISVVFHHGGQYDAASASFGQEKFEDMDMHSVDFSSVNEIGEGASIKIEKENNGFMLSVIASAPSQFQLREIMTGLVSSLRKVDCYMARDKAEVAARFQY